MVFLLQGCCQLHSYAFNGKEKDDDIKGSGNSYNFGARVLDSRLGRWFCVDPFAVKYPDLSPYGFVGNMPIIAIDPDGKKIRIVSTDPEFRKKTFSDIQKLTNTELVLLKNGQVVDAHKAASLPESFIEMRGDASKVDKKTGEGSKPFGTTLVSDLIDSEKTVKINNANEMDKNDINYNENGAKADEVQKAYSLTYGLETLQQDGIEPTGEEGFGEGSGSTINYNPDDNRDGTGPGSGIMNADGTCGKPPVIGLGHELIHSRHMANGEVDGGDSGTVQPENRAGVSNEEHSTRMEENILRGENGIIPRAEPVEKDD